MDKNMSPKEFLQFIWPDISKGGVYCIAAIEPKPTAEQDNRKAKVKHYFCTAIEEAVSKAEAIKTKDKWNAYYAVGSFKEGTKRRLADQSQDMKCLFLDLDVGKGKDSYDSQQKALVGLRDFCRDVKMPKPTVLSSGAGVHAYWVFDLPVPTSKWKELATDFKDLCINKGLVIDAHVPADSARLLRVLDTHNFNQSLTAPTTVYIFQVGRPMSYDVYRNLIPKSSNGTNGLLLKPPPNALPDDPVSKAILNNKKSSFKIILEESQRGAGCAQILDIYENQEDVPYDLWRAGLSIAQHCVDSETAVHDISNKHSKYSAKETTEKAQDTGGPQYCATFERLNPEGCKKCPLRGKISTPIQIGSYIAETKKPVEVIEKSGDTNKESKFVIPMLPSPYFRGEYGGIYLREYNTEDNGEGKNIDKLIYHNDLYVVKRLLDQEEGFMALIRLHLPEDGVREFTVPLTAMNAMDRLRDILSKNGVTCGVGRSTIGGIMIYLSKWVNYLESKEKASPTYNQMGWAEDGDAFVLGKRVFKAGGIYSTPLTPTITQYAPRFTHKGKLDKWTEAIQRLYGRKGEEARRFVLGFGLASPLFKYTNVNGGLIHIRSDGSGKSKSATLLSVNSIWGHPKGLMMKGADTVNSFLLRIGIYQNVPLCIDEITNLEPDLASKFIYCISDGEGINRLKGSENLERLNNSTWSNGVISTANSSLIDILSSKKASPEGELMRMLQFEFAPNGLDDEENGTLVRRLFNHYGVAAEIIVPWLIANSSKCEQLLTDTQRRVREEAKFSSRERYWTAMAGIGLTGLQIGNDLGIWDLDIKDTKDWLIGTLVKAKTTPKGIIRDPRNIIGLFLQEYTSNNMLKIKDGVDLRKEKNGVSNSPEPMPSDSFRIHGGVKIRYETDTNLVWVAANVLQAWCSKKQIDYTNLVKQLKESKIVLGFKSKRLTKGYAPGANVHSIKMDAKELEVDVELKEPE